MYSIQCNLCNGKLAGYPFRLRAAGVRPFVCRAVRASQRTRVTLDACAGSDGWLAPYTLSQPMPPLRLFAAMVFALVAATAVGATMAAVGPKDRRLTNVRYGITVEAPPGWTLSEHTGYRETVALLLHPDSSRISVTAAWTEARDPSALLESNRRGLALQGLVVSRTAPGPLGSMLLDASAPGRREAVRQIYVVRETLNRRQAVVLTLVCRASLLGAHGPSLDLAFSRLGLDTPSGLRSGASANLAGRGGSAGQLRLTEPDGNATPQQPQHR
jgi:hypothetical protein